MKHKYDKAFIIGSDQAQEDILFWWIHNARKYSPNIPIQLVDFGLSDITLLALQNQVDEILTINKEKNMKAWFNKPKAMLATNAKTTLWMDIDTEIVKDISDIFDLAEDHKLGLVKDQYYCQQNKEQYNTGVVLYKNRPQFLFEWKRHLYEVTARGDQEILLDYMIKNPDKKENFVVDLPDKYNYVRLMYRTNPNIEDLRVIHWTGKTGKTILRSKKINPTLPDGGSKTTGHDWNGDINQYSPEKMKENK